MNDQVPKTSTSKKHKKKGHHKGAEVGDERSEVTSNDHCPRLTASSKTASVEKSGKHHTTTDKHRKNSVKSCSSDGSVRTTNSEQVNAVNDLSKPNKDVSLDIAGEKTKAELKAERRALFEAERAAKAKVEVQQPVTNGGSIGNEASVDKDVVGTESKSQAELKAERRALFEAQRAAKANVEVHSVGKEATTVKDAVGTEGKSKAEMKAERRALQEAQRAAKAGKKSESQTSVSKPNVTQEGMVVTANLTVKGSVSITRQNLQMMKTKTSKQKLFSHLPQYERNFSVLQAINDNIHPAIVKLGLQYADGVICGSNARCVALIRALQTVINDFKTPKDKEISYALPEIVLDASFKYETIMKELSQNNDEEYYWISFLEKCRNVSVGMKNVSKKLREEIFNMDKTLSETEVKTELINVLQNFFKDNVEKAHEAIVNLAKDKITPNDVILTYGCSYVVKQVLAAAHKNVDFRVIVVDSRPKLEGRSMFDFLVKEGIKCSYILINAVSYAMQEATKVVFGAHALLANGYVMSRVGSSQVALVAKAYNKPVLVCCETYKFCELVQTDSFVVNELGDKNDIIQTNGRVNPLEGLSDLPHLNVLNLYYDVTPPDLITVVINDVCLVPCTSVPVLLRVKPTKR